MNNLKVYVAAGWFSDEQEKARMEVINACKTVNVDIYSPKDDMLHIDGETDPEAIFLENVYQINKADFIIASTEGKDMGTLFECGLAYGRGTPIVYYYKGNGPFNLMLARSGFCVCTTYEELCQYLEESVDLNRPVHKTAYKGAIE